MLSEEEQKIRRALSHKKYYDSNKEKLQADKRKYYENKRLEKEKKKDELWEIYCKAEDKDLFVALLLKRPIKPIMEPHELYWYKLVSKPLREPYETQKTCKV